MSCTSSKNYVDVGTRPSSFQGWEYFEARFHGFEDMSFEEDDDDEYFSPPFMCLGHEWTLGVCPGVSGRSPDNNPVSVYLNHHSNGSNSIKYHICVRDSNGEEIGCCAGTEYFDGVDVSVGKAVFALRSKILESLEEGTLTVEVRMQLEDPPKFPRFAPPNLFCSAGLKILSDEKSADAVFEVGGQAIHGQKKSKTSPTTFHAHSLILKHCAPTLAALCESSKDHDAPIPINDVKPKIFGILLRSIYGGVVTTEELEANSKEIIDAADKYGAVSLKLSAETKYVNSTEINIDNLLDNLLYADSKNCALLKEAVVDFIIENGDDVFEKVSLKDVPGSMFSELLAAVNRGKLNEKKCISGPNKFGKMRVNTLRTLCLEKGLDVDGSREAMIKSLKAWEEDE